MSSGALGASVLGASRASEASRALQSACAAADAWPLGGPIRCNSVSLCLAQVSELDAALEQTVAAAVDGFGLQFKRRVGRDPSNQEVYDAILPSSEGAGTVGAWG